MTQAGQRGEAEFIRNAAKDVGDEVVAFEAFREGDNDFRPQLSTITAAKADWLGLYGATPELAKVVNQMAELGVKAEMLTGFGTFNDPVAWDLTEGKVKGGSSWSASFALEDPARPEVGKMVQAYKKEYGRAHFDEAPALRHRAEESEELLAPCPRTRAVSAKTRWPAGRTVGYDGRAMGPAPLLSLRAITKRFPGVTANDRVDLDVHRGEVHGLVGENGAGKSTLVKILYGFYRADAGEIRLEGRPVDVRSPHDARRLGIGLVFQDFVQIPALTVAENIALFLSDLPWVLDQGAVAGRIRSMSARYGFEVDPSAEVWRLSVGERQKVEVLKLLLADEQILVLDEPTRSLAPHEVDGLFASFAELRGDGYAVVFIAHKLREVLACADRITVMRRGRVAGTLPRAEASEAVLVSLMFGGALAEPVARARVVVAAATTPVLALEGVGTRAEGRETALVDIDLTIRPGEIVGVAGVSGNGQRELGDVILGVEPCVRGVKRLGGREATAWSVARVRASGVAFVPEDALGMAAVPSLTPLANMALADPRRYARAGGLAMDWPAARRDLEAALARLSVTLPSLDIPASALSGGNVQRMILARELAHRSGSSAAVSGRRWPGRCGRGAG